MLAVDRTNDKVADLYLPHHPAVLKALRRVVHAGRTFGKDVSICGDMAHNPKYLPLLLGLGLRTLSLDARYLPRLHERLSQLSLSACEELTAKVLSQTQISCITQLLGES
jgi:phosphotransferase system enzyme I (PtsP)